MPRVLLARIFSFVLSGLLSFPAIAGPDWKKTCRLDCKENRDYLVTSEGIICKGCRAQIEAVPAPRMSLDLNAVNKLADGAGSSVDDQGGQVKLLKSVTDSDRELINLLAGKPDKGMMTGTFKDMALYDLPLMYQKWVDAGNSGHPLDQLTYKILSQWNDSSELTVSIPAQLRELDMALLLSNNQVSQASASAMLFIDNMWEDGAFKHLAQKEDATGIIAKYFLTVQQSMASKKEYLYRKSSRSAAFQQAGQYHLVDESPVDISTVSTLFSQMECRPEFFVLGRDTVEWDGMLKKQLMELGAEEKDFEALKKKIRAVEKEVLHPLQFGVTLQFNNDGLVPSKLEALLKNDPSNGGVRGLIAILSQLENNRLLKINIGPIAWYIRKSLTGNDFYIYLPVFCKIVTHDIFKAAETLCLLYSAFINDSLKRQASQFYQDEAQLKKELASMARSRNDSTLWYEAVAKGREIITDPYFQVTTMLLVSAGAALAYKAIKK